jgi:enoyl-CoA hydratase/carnithine racemase
VPAARSEQWDACAAATLRRRYGPSDGPAVAEERTNVGDIEWSLDEGVATILLNRPESKNAFTPDVIIEWARMLDSAATDNAVRALVVTGAGDAFCAGADIKRLSDDVMHHDEADGPRALTAKQSLQRVVHRVALAMDGLTKPVVAAVNGPAIGAGMDMALMCDFRFASTTARFSEAYVRVGLVPGNGGCWYLPRIVGVEKALELLLTGDFVDADEALRIGLVSRVLAPDELYGAAHGFAARLAAMPPAHVQLIKRNVYASTRLDLRTSLELAASHMGIVRTLADSAEAMAAFRERRPGAFHGV